MADSVVEQAHLFSQDVPPDLSANVAALRAMDFENLKEQELLKKLSGELQDRKAAIHHCRENEFIAFSETYGVLTYSSLGRKAVVANQKLLETTSGRDKVDETAPGNGPHPEPDSIAQAKASKPRKVVQPAAAPASIPPTPQMVKIDTLVIDEEIQPREKRDEETVRNYELAIKDGAEFPPILVFQCEDALYLVDGFHRVEAHRKAGVDQIRALVRMGGITESCGLPGEKRRRTLGVCFVQTPLQQGKDTPHEEGYREEGQVGTNRFGIAAAGIRPGRGSGRHRRHDPDGIGQPRSPARTGPQGSA